MTDLRTSRLVLRDVTLDDVDAVHAYASDPEVCRFMVWGPNTLDDSRAFVKAELAVLADPQRRSYNRMVTLAGTGELIGAIELRLDKVDYRAEFGYTFRRDQWGQGYATEASKALLDWGFDYFGLERVAATCDPENPASARVLQKAGLRYEGRMRHHLKLRDGWRDSLMFAVLADDRQ